MTPTLLRPPSTAILALIAGLTLAGPARPAASDTPAVLEQLARARLENLSADTSARVVAYENRRYRHSAEAVGRVHAALGEPWTVIERRLGLPAASIAVRSDSVRSRFRLHYPSDPGFPAAGGSAWRSPTFRTADLDVGPLVDYRIGQLFNPLQLRLELQPRLRLNPWPGSSIQLGLLFPVVDDYPADELDRDAGRVRPGRMSLDQFAWVPGAALVSLSAGYFGDHRWGTSLGATRPLADGTVLVDAQFEQTGYVAFADSGTFYSNPRVTSGHFGVSFRPGYSDVTIRGRAARFLYGDQGVELEVRRSFGDLDVAYFAQRTVGVTTYGVRLDLPVPPMRRAGGVPLRVQPVPRFAISFRDASELFGTSLTGVASREDYLRQLNRTALESESARYRHETGLPVPDPPQAAEEWVSLGGMTGFIQTPWAGVMPDRQFEAGYNYVPRKWAYDHRGTHDNQVFYTTLGFLPRVETCMRWTRIPGYHSFEEIVPDSKLVDIDRMTSGRLALLPPREGRPGLAAGIEDVQGTRRFHSAYVVGGIPARIFQVRARGSLGYGFRAFAASRYVLDGVFGAVECVPTRFARVQLEYDSEKWNAAVGFLPGAGFRIRAAILNLEKLSLGAGWSHPL